MSMSSCFITFSHAHILRTNSPEASLEHPKGLPSMPVLESVAGALALLQPTYDVGSLTVNSLIVRLLLFGITL